MFTQVHVRIGMTLCSESLKQTLQVKTTCEQRPIYHSPTCGHYRQVELYILILGMDQHISLLPPEKGPYIESLIAPIFSSPEPKAHRWAYSIGRHPSSVRRRRPSIRGQYFQTTSPLKPWSRFLPYFTYIGMGNKKYCFLSQSDKNSGCYGNI